MSRATDDYLKAAPRAAGTGWMRRWERVWPGIPPAVFFLLAAVVVFAVWAGIGLFLSKVLRHDPIGRMDMSVAHWFVHQRTPLLDNVTLVLTYLSETITVAIVGTLVFISARIAWRRWRESLLVVAVLGGEVLIFVALTLAVERNRPPVPHLDVAPPTSSFPSGHTTAAVVLYGMLAFLASNRFRSAAVVWIARFMAIGAPILVGISRMYRGMHFLTDVIAGALLGAVWLFIAIRGVRLGVYHRDLRREGSEDHLSGGQTHSRQVATRRSASI
jgi:undecaprenyl-diphosphatase